MHRSHYVEGAELHLCDLDPKVKVIGKKVGICDGVPSTAALVLFISVYEVVLYNRLYMGLPVYISMP